MDQALRPAITILIALAPAALALWWGRRLSRQLDDPLLPERLFAYRRRVGVVFGAAMGVLAISAPSQCIWSIPLTVLARMSAAYPLRKALHNETWSLGAYLSFFGRLVLAGFGIWLLLITLPFVAMTAGSRDWLLGAVLAVIVVAWHKRSSEVFRWMLRARPVDDAEVITRFERMLRECGLPQVSLDRVDMRGGAFANAVALPSIRRPAVVVTDTLLARLDLDETSAILAHELAHLEFYNPKLLRRNHRIVCALASAGALWHPVMRTIAPQQTWAAPLLWPVLLVVMGLFRAQHRQKHETESDLRAVQLTGNPDAVIHALTKLHVFARVPRRWDSELERRATHPSLARRIQAIRVAAGTAETFIGEPVTFAAPDGIALVTFYDHHLEWRDRASNEQSIDYGRLVELRIHARTSGTPRLVAVGSQPRHLEMALQPGDVVRIQSVLDIVDTRLAKAEPPPVVPLRVRRVLSLLALFSAVALGQASVMVAGALALLRPAPQLIAACGVSAVTAAWLAWRDGSWLVMGTPAWVMATLVLSGLALIGVAVANRHEVAPKWVPQLIAFLALCAAVIWVFVGIRGGDALELHRRTLEWPSMVILTLGLAAACVCARSSRVRWVAVPVALVAVCAGYSGSDAFVGRFVRDPFVSAAPAITVSTVTGPPLAEFSVELNVSSLWISNTGRFVAVQTWNKDQHSQIHAGPVGGPLTAFPADEAAFLDDGRLLLMSGGAREPVLRLVDLRADNRETWSIQPTMSWGALSVDRASERWRLLGWASNHAASAGGHIGESEFLTQQWLETADEADDQDVLAVSNGVALMIERRPVDAVPNSLWGWLMYMRTAPRVDSRLVALHTRGSVELAESRIELDCARSTQLDAPAICASFDGRHSRFFEVNPANPSGQSLVPLATIPGSILLENSSDRGWVVGWWEHGPAVFAPARRQAIRLVPSDGERPYRLAVGETVLASVSSRMTRSTIRVYSLPPRPSA